MTARPTRPGKLARARVVQVARAAGCTCRRPDVDLGRLHGTAGLQHYVMAHDDTCPLIGGKR